VLGDGEFHDDVAFDASIECATRVDRRHLDQRQVLAIALAETETGRAEIDA
jgi:hypothetical protein